MCKHILYILILAGLMSCQKDKTTSIFGETPDQRMEKALADYKARLTGAEYGWKTTVYPPNGGGYAFYFTFGTDDRVSMYGDVTGDAAATAQSSTYRLKAVQRPSLLFDTYSYLHLLSDPDPNVYGGEVGQGYSVDFEFSIDSVSADTIKMTGIMYDTKIIFVRATKAEHDAYTSGDYATQITDMEDEIAANPWQYLQFSDGKKLQVSINTFSKTFTLMYIDDAGNVQILKTAYAYSTTGIALQTPVTYGSNTFSELLWDADNQVFYVNINGTRVDVKTSTTSIIPLHELIGVSYSDIVVPPQAIPGWSDSFTDMWATLADDLINGPYGLTLYYTDFLFDATQNIMYLDVYVIQRGNLYLAEYPYTYTKTADGVFDFTAQPYTGNATLIDVEMAPFRNHLANDHFTMDFYADNGQLKSVESPDFYFTGFLE